MKAFNRFFSFSIPLIAILLSYSIYIALDKAVTTYKNTIASDYSIVVVSSSELLKSQLENQDINIKTLEQLNNNKLISKLKDKLSPRSIELLNQKLPYFYKIYLNNFPTTFRLNSITKQLQEIPSITKVETFSKDHNQVYSIITNSENIINILFAIIVLFGLLILSKHIKIWVYEHNEKISIMRLHGASILYCAKPIINIAILSAIFSSAVVVALTYYILNNFKFAIIVRFDLDFLQIIALAFIISITTVLLVLFRHKFND